MTRRLGAFFIYAAALSLWAARLCAQQQSQPIPELFKDRALAVRFQAVASELSGSESWEEESVRYTVPGSPVGLKLVGSNLIILIQVTPFDSGKEGVLVVIQGQVWIRKDNGELSYRTAMETLTIKYGERVLFYPIGRDAEGNSRVRLEVVVEKYRELPSQGKEGTPEASKSPEQGSVPKPRK